MTGTTHRTLYELGRGGMGTVELVEERGAGGHRLVAIKRILPDLAREARARGMFLKEARLLARIDHPNVVRTFEVDPGDEDQPPKIVMEFVDGASLHEALGAAKTGLPVPIAARIAHDVALGLHAAHELRDETGRPLGVVHRDVSPHNVVVTFDGRVKLLDFGVAKIDEGTRTQTGEVRGKTAYMAPEQALADPVDRRSDVYALGALLYEMLTGARMHGEGTDLEILRRMATERPTPVVARAPHVPQGLSQLVERMTAESRDARPSTAGEVAAALAPFAEGADPATVAGWLRRTLPAAEDRRKLAVDAAMSAGDLTKIVPPRAPVWAFVAVAAVVALAAGGLALSRVLASESDEKRASAVASSAPTARATSSVHEPPPLPSAVVAGAPVASTIAPPRPRPPVAVPPTLTPVAAAPPVATPAPAPTPPAPPVATTVTPKIDTKPF